MVIFKKFPWKHFPKLEDFIITNPGKYLAHSTMNYTAKHSHYNHLLIDRLLELAPHHNYAFDEEDFDFVTVRDHIRCYYNSYAQSSRRRGL